MRMTRDWWAVLLAAVAAVLVKLGVVCRCAMVTVAGPAPEPRAASSGSGSRSCRDSLLLAVVGYAGKLDRAVDCLLRQGASI